MVLVACRGNAPLQVTPTPQNSLGEPTPTLEGPATPTVTPTLKPPTVWLILPQEAPSIYGDLPATLQSLADAQGWQVTRLETLPQALPSEVRAVVAPLSTGLVPLAQSHPQVWFIGAQSSSETAPPENLSVLDPSTASPSAQAFLAGYTAALSTEDWRVAVIAPDEETLNAFRDGAVYFCGLCRPAYPPFAPYPLTVQLSPDASADQWYSALNDLQSQGVQTLYIAPSLWTDDALLLLLQDTNFRLIADHPLEDALATHFLASIAPDPLSALRDAWEDIQQGQGGGSYPLALRVQVGHADWLSPGRQRLVEDLADQLQEGIVLP